MSLITRCPACGTMFKVVPDQLRISEGWVRCGHCAEVFDASVDLHEDVSPEPEPAGEPAAEPDEFHSSLNTELGEALPDDGPDSEQLEAEAQVLRETPLDRPFELRRQDPGGEVAQPLPSRFIPAPESELEPELHDLSFVRQARTQEFWRRPVIRASMLFLLFTLGLLLAAQIGVYDRDRLAAAWPALRPWLSRLCVPLKCRIAPPRQIDAIAIDSSSFNRLGGEAYRLNFTLKNQAAIPVAMPALELTLTDGQDQPLLRRVLLPADLGADAGVIAAGAEWSGSLPVAAGGNGSGARIAGYRLLAFYP